MPFILDASVSACWVFADEDHPIANVALERLRGDSAWVPSLWWYEIRNTLVVNERRGRLTQADTTTFLGSLVRLAIIIDQTPDDASTLALARTHTLSVYDAAYLSLAKRHAAPLVTLDRQLRRAAQAENVTLLEAAA